MRKRGAEAGNAGLEIVDFVHTMLDVRDAFVTHWESAAAKPVRKETSL
jgi:hypothetical protein